jgi:hypothetical protein
MEWQPIDHVIARWWQDRTGLKPKQKSHILTFYAKGDVPEYDTREDAGNGWFRYTRALNWDEKTDPRTPQELAADLFNVNIARTRT